jgi:hypothetical protein
VKDQNELQAMRRYLLIHTVVLVHFATEMKDRIDVLDWDKFSMYDQDDLLQLAFVARETLVELESENLEGVAGGLDNPLVEVEYKGRVGKWVVILVYLREFYEILRI